MKRKSPLTRLQLRSLEDYLIAHKAEIESERIGILGIVQAIEKAHGFRPSKATVSRTAKLFGVQIRRTRRPGESNKYRYAPVLLALVEQVDALCQSLGVSTRTPMWVSHVEKFKQEWEQR